MTTADQDLAVAMMGIVDASHRTRATIDMADLHMLVRAAFRHDEISLPRACELLGMHRDAVIAAYGIDEGD
jgi:hypothetical protein